MIVFVMKHRFYKYNILYKLTVIDLISTLKVQKCSQYCTHTTRLIKKVEALAVSTGASLDFQAIHEAIHWVKKHHAGQLRACGKPFYTHLLEVAYMVADHNLKTDVLVASILHDIVEDTEVTLGMILDRFGWRIAEMVDRLTRDRIDGSKLSVEELLYNAYTKDDTEVILIKIMDRLHNTLTLSFLPEDKQKKKITETIQNFLIFAEELSLGEVSKLLYQECLKLNIQLGTVDPKDIKKSESVFDETPILPPPTSQNT